MFGFVVFDVLGDGSADDFAFASFLIDSDLKILIYKF